MKCWNSAQVNNAGVAGIEIDVDTVFSPSNTEVEVSL